MTITPFYRSPVFWRCHHTWELLYKFNTFQLLTLVNCLPQAQLCAVLNGHGRSHWEMCSNPIPASRGALALVPVFGFSVQCVCSVLCPWVSAWAQSIDYFLVCALALWWTGSLSVNPIFLGWDPRPYHSPGSNLYLNHLSSQWLSKGMVNSGYRLDSRLDCLVNQERCHLCFTHFCLTP